MILAIDTETTGLDLFHGALPYFVTMCFEDGTQKHWRWRVDPLTREVYVDENDALEIRELVEQADEIVTQNGKFDLMALELAGVLVELPWHKVHDLTIVAHLLASNHAKSLDALSIEYLGYDIQPLEDEMHEACNAARRYCRSNLKDWRIAHEDLPEMPSARSGDKEKSKKRGDNIESPWKADTWLPAQLAAHLKYPLNHPWYNVTEKYANMDSAVTLALWPTMKALMEHRGLMKWYEHRRQLPKLAYLLQVRGPTLNGEKQAELRTRFKGYLDDASQTCLDIAAKYEVETCETCGRMTGEPTYAFDKRCECGKPDEEGKVNKRKPKLVTGPYPLALPDGNVNDNLKSFCFNVLNLEHIQNPKAKTEAPTLDAKNAIPHYLVTLPQESDSYKFIEAYADRNSFTTAINYLDQYERFWLPAGITNEKGEHLWYRLYPWLNPTATDHIRWSCKGPNVQNVSKGSSECKRCEGDGCSRCGYTGISKASLRQPFGPMPGREWWCLDAQNIERRMPAYEANETAIIELLEEPNKPPYYGSEHALVGHIIWTEFFEKCRDDKGVLDGRIFKKKYKDTYYQWTKNFNFALQYQCGKSTADKAAHREGAFELVKQRFAGQTELNNRCVAFANKHGYVETIIDKDIDPLRGYPILVNRGSYGRVEPTKPLNYHSSGTAMVWTNKAMIRVQAILDEWNKKAGKIDYWMTLQVHDELTIDMPKRADPRTSKMRSNFGRVKEIQRVMESCGHGIGIPTPVGLDYCPVSWADAVTF